MIKFIKYKDDNNFKVTDDFINNNLNLETSNNQNLKIYLGKKIYKIYIQIIY